MPKGKAPSKAVKGAADAGKDSLLKTLFVLIDPYTRWSTHRRRLVGTPKDNAHTRAASLLIQLHRRPLAKEAKV